MTSKFTVKQTDKNACVVNIKAKESKSWEQWFLLSSDRHHDNPKTDQKLEKFHLDQALERNAGIIDAGDLLCLMQGRFDKRSSKSSVRPEHQVDDYFDAVIEDAADFYEPYAHNWISMGYGNHDLAIKQRLETDPIQRLAGILNARTRSRVLTLGYTGWIVFKFDSGKHFVKTLWFNHGSGQGAMVTKGAISAAREREYVNADIMLSGHNHQQWEQWTKRLHITRRGKVVEKDCVYVKTPTYKRDYTGIEGFSTLKGLGPRPMGAYWLKFYFRDGDIRFNVVKAD